MLCFLQGASAQPRHPDAAVPLALCPFQKGLYAPCPGATGAKLPPLTPTSPAFSPGRPVSPLDSEFNGGVCLLSPPVPSCPFLCWALSCC